MNEETDRSLYLATSHGPLIVSRKNNRWRTDRPLDGHSASRIVADPHRSKRVFCTTASDGVWRSDDAGRNWQRVFDGVPYNQTTALAVSGAEQIEDHGVVYVGTEPSAVIRSNDGGETWQECTGLTDLSSSSTWRFPPRPETHHVRWIEPDPYDAGRLYVAIEAGALLQSPDGGATWEDRVEGSPRDTHQLATHPSAPGRLWSAAGDGFFESYDTGETWRTAERGLRHRYCWSVAVDPSDPEVVVLSAAASARQAHDVSQAEGHLYRRTTSDGPWQDVTDGLPDPAGTRAFALAAAPTEPGVFYAGTDGGLYRSTDTGKSWHELPVDWPSDGTNVRVHAVTTGDTR